MYLRNVLSQVILLDGKIQSLRRTKTYFNETIALELQYNEQKTIMEPNRG